MFQTKKSLSDRIVKMFIFVQKALPNESVSKQNKQSFVCVDFQRGKKYNVSYQLNIISLWI